MIGARVGRHLGGHLILNGLQLERHSLPISPTCIHHCRPCARDFPNHYSQFLQQALRAPLFSATMCSPSEEVTASSLCMSRRQANSAKAATPVQSLSDTQRLSGSVSACGFPVAGRQPRHLCSVYVVDA